MPKIILFTHQKGGVGKSTLCLNLALNIAQSANVAIIDTDVQGSLACLSESIKTLDIIKLPETRSSINQLDYDFIFIDTPPYLSNHIEELMSLSDLIVIPTKAGVLDLLAIRNTVQLIENKNQLEKSLIVMNMIKPNTTLTLEVMIELVKYNIKVAQTNISDLVSYTRSVIYNGIVNDKKAEAQIKQLTKEVLQTLLN